MAKIDKDAGTRVDAPTGTEFVGHEWDGIEELNTPLPRWWLLTFYACIVWAIGYTIMYPAWPMISSATTGVTGWTSRGQFEAEVKAQTAKRAPLLAAIAATGAQRVIVTHGQVAVLMRWLTEQGLQADRFTTEYDDTDEDSTTVESSDAQTLDTEEGPT